MKRGWIWKYGSVPCLALGVLTGCLGETGTSADRDDDDDQESTLGEAQQGLTVAACHLSYLRASNPHFQSDLDRIRRSGNPTDFAMDGTANTATIACNGGIMASIDKSAGGSPIELLSDDYHYDTSTPYYFGHYTQGCLAQDGGAGQLSMGQGGNSCNTRGYAADTLPRYFSTHYGDWATHAAASQPLIISAKTADGKVSSFNLPEIHVRSGAVDVYTSSNGKKWKLAASHLTGVASTTLTHLKMAMIVSSGAGTLPNYGAAPAAIDDIVIDWDPPTINLFGPFTRLVNLAYAPPGASSHVDYTSASRTGSSSEVKTTTSDGVTFSGDFEIFGVGSGAEVKFTYGTSSGYAHADQFTNSSSYTISEGKDVPEHASDRFYVWTNAAIEHTDYHDGRKPTERLVTFQYATPNVEVVTAAQLQGSEAIPPYMDLSQLTSDERAAIVAADPFAVDPSFVPQSVPARFALLGTYDLRNNPAIPNDSATYTLEWDQQDDVSHGYTEGHEATALVKAKISAWGADGSASAGYTYSEEYEQNETHSTGSTITSSMTLGSPEPCRHMGVKVYLDTMFNTYVFSKPQALSNGDPAGHTCLKDVCPEVPKNGIQNNQCECHSDVQCPESGSCDVGNTWTCRPVDESWSFENGKSTAPFYVDPTFGKSLGAPTLSTKEAYEGSGSQALAVPFARFLGLRFSVLNGAAVKNLVGKRLRVRVLVDGPSFRVDNDEYISANVKTTLGDVSDFAEAQNIKVGEWTTLDAAIENNNASAGDLTRSTEIYLRLYLYSTPANWTGTAYFDTIQIY